MQIKYKITLLYISTVAIILLILCFSIYFISAKDRTELYQDRLHSKALAILQLLNADHFEADEIKQINRTASGALDQKNIKVFDESGRLIFSDRDDDAPQLIVGNDKLNKVNKELFYEYNERGRDVIAIKKFGKIVFLSAYDDDKVDWLSKLKFILTLCFFLSIAIVLIVGYLFSLKLVHSISLIKNNLSLISSQDLSLRLDTGNNQDELEQLATSINEVLTRLQFSFETQSRFIDNASHELSTPIAVIMSQLDVAKRKTRTPEEYQLVIDSIYEDVSRLNILLKTLLDLAKVSGSAKGIELTSIRIDDLLMGIPIIVKKINTDYKVKMLFDEFPEDETSLIVFGNESLLLCAIQNIVLNSCKYSNDKSATILLDFKANNIVITIEDKGDGIEVSELQNIFYPFYRGSNADSTIVGIGLGLSLANNIIKLHDGSITVTSQKNIGSKFIVTLHSIGKTKN